ncbi:phage tail protein [Kumtagia ephedrae]|uniref:Phage tail protein n=1 Tax=Kumtagia ephedrae TaxID=2116701 RepID=A0A2P7ST84_9HYPH|nr:tail fiber protein [Mesorhizobium ephedrae]PSJ65699.1 phage tail protein [Mesorhizobium ephedrae]
MAPYVGEIRIFAGNFAPAGWLFCQGQTVSISEYEALFQLIGTTYGGDGQETFDLPNLASRVPIHMGTGPDGTTYQLGEMDGVESVTLTTQQIPIHSHPPVASTSSATSPSPAGQVIALPAAPPSVVNPLLFGTDPPQVPLSPASIAPTGGSQPHENMQPYLCINYIISMYGVFPSQT